MPKYIDMYARLVANTAEPESHTACWPWTGRTRRHGGGPRPAMNVRRDGKHSTVNAARVMLEQFGPLPDEHNASHLCVDNWCCINPDHLIGETIQDNIKRRDGVALALPMHVGHACDVDWLAGELCDPSQIPF